MTDEPIIWRDHPPEPVARPTSRTELAKLFGERTLGTGQNTRLLVQESAHRAMLEHVSGDLDNELGGLLYGRVFAGAAGGHWTEVLEACPAQDTHSSPASVEFTAATWASLGPQDDELTIVGWYHSHPGLGVFLSETDQRTQRSFFRQPWQVGVVIDPLIDELGAFAGEDGQEVEYQIVPKREATPAETRALANGAPRPLRLLVGLVLALVLGGLIWRFASTWWIAFH